MTLTLQEIQERKDARYDKYENVPASLVEKSELGSCSDGLTLLKYGREWAYEFIERHQPRTWKCLSHGSEFTMFVRKLSLAELVDVIQLVNERPIGIHRQRYGFNPSDDSFPARSYAGKWARSLPEPIRLAYYHRIDGMFVPENAALGMKPGLLPFPVARPWVSIDHFLSGQKLATKYLPLIDEMIPGAKHEEKHMGYGNVTMFLSSWGSFSAKRKTDGDFLFVKQHIQDGVVYYIRDRDVPGMTILADPAEAIDRYCEHVLLRKEGRFDFRPWAIPFKSPSA